MKKMCPPVIPTMAWLCGNLCAWPHHVPYVLITGRAHCFHDRVLHVSMIKNRPIDAMILQKET